MKYLIIGGGGHARVIIDLIQCVGKKSSTLGIADPNLPIGSRFMDIPVLGGDEVIYDFAATEVELVNGIGSVSTESFRKQVYEKLKSERYTFSTLVHPSAVIAENVILGEGTVVMAGSIIQAGSKIGDNVILNTGCLIDHDCIINDHVHIAPRTTISGGVQIGAGSFIGIGTSISQGIRIGTNTLVGAGSVVIQDLGDNMKAFGNPAKVRE